VLLSWLLKFLDRVTSHVGIGVPRRADDTAQVATILTWNFQENRLCLGRILCRYVLDLNLAARPPRISNVIRQEPIFHPPRQHLLASSLHADDRSHRETPSRHPEALQPLQVSEAMPRDAMCDAEDAMALERLDAKYEPCVCPRRRAICHGAEPLVQPQHMQKSVDTLGCNLKMVASASFVCRIRPDASEILTNSRRGILASRWIKHSKAVVSAASRYHEYAGTSEDTQGPNHMYIQQTLAYTEPSRPVDVTVLVALHSDVCQLFSTHAMASTWRMWVTCGECG
jgi:hypothetical protein